MWVKVQSRDELYARLEYTKKHSWGSDYVSGKEQFAGPGWYWVVVKSMYFGRGATDQVVVAVPAEERIREIKEGIKELVDELVTARRATRG